MFHEAVKLYLKEGTTIEVLFEDGLTKRYEMLSLVNKYPILNDLKDRSLFLKGHAMSYAGIIWNDDIDMSANTIYEDGITVGNNDENVPLYLLGNKLKHLRQHSELTQEELSERCGITQADLSRIEKGSFNPSVKTLERIAKGLGKNLDIDFK